MNFNLTEDEKFIDVASDSVFQVTAKKLPLVEFWCNVKEE